MSTLPKRLPFRPAANPMRSASVTNPPAGNLDERNGARERSIDGSPIDGTLKRMDAIFGTWQLVRTSSRSSTGEDLPPPFGGEKAMGRVVLDREGRMMAVVVDGRTELPEGATRDYSSYCGRYTFDGKKLITRVDAASDPARLGTDQVRDVRFEDGLMVLRPPARPYGTGEEHRELHWRRISEE